MLNSIVKCIVPCSWSLFVFFMAAMMLGLAHKRVHFELLPKDYYLYNPEQRKRFWNTTDKRRRERFKIILISPAILIIGLVFIYIASNVKIVSRNSLSPVEPVVHQQSSMETVSTATPTPSQ